MERPDGADDTHTQKIAGHAMTGAKPRLWSRFRLPWDLDCSAVPESRALGQPRTVIQSLPQLSTVPESRALG